VRPPRRLFYIWLGAAAVPVVSHITRESLSDAPGALAARSHHGGNVDPRTSCQMVTEPALRAVTIWK
jgi:hypothetical protein